ncbi:radical SAM/SPASM domain-containing protein [Rhodopseudomonas pseudopalustris]|nr:radical SAM protein [Rhodopseudomonas pseudopalustris]SEO10257.1 radical SAM additional 4Fe4S-binding SPASM domain-containing protein [Rhodopseudomonas pseudopalustris]
MISSRHPTAGLVPEAPYHVVWLATDACTARCQHCSSNSAKQSPDELTTSEAMAMIDDLAAAGVVDLGISGGESLLRGDILDVLAHAKKRGLAVGIATNGAKLTPHRAAALAGLGLDRLQVSLDGFAEQHDELRRWPGLFERALATIATAQAAGLRVNVCCTITRLNANTLEPFVDFIAGLGIGRLNLSRFIPTGRGDDALDPGDARWRSIIELCGGLQRKYHRRLAIVTHLAQHILVDPEAGDLPAFTGCQAGRGQGCISANGTIYPCVLLPVAIGNIRSHPFRQIWTGSPLIQAFQARDKLEGACGACAVRDRCGGCRAVAFAASGNPFSSDPRCWVHEPQLGSCLH